jgi:hypothetical protein
MREISIATSASSAVFTDHRSFENETLLLPDTLMDGSASDAAAALRPAFDAMWQAAGFRGSPSYDKAGVWQPPQY